MSNPLYAIDYLVRGVTCPKCGAESGVNCDSMWTFHVEREDAWREQGGQG